MITPPSPPPLPHYSHLPFPSTSLNRGTVLSSLKATIKADISRPEIERRLDNRNKAKAKGIPLGKFEHNNMLEALRRNIDIVAHLNVLRGTNANLPPKMFK